MADGGSVGGWKRNKLFKTQIKDFRRDVSSLKNEFEAKKKERKNERTNKRGKIFVQHFI